jgi:hypothetical protein
MSNVTRLIAQTGAVDDVETAGREHARPDGFVEYNQGFEKPQPNDRSSRNPSKPLMAVRDVGLVVTHTLWLSPEAKNVAAGITHQDLRKRATTRRLIDGRSETIKPLPAEALIPSGLWGLLASYDQLFGI